MWLKHINLPVLSPKSQQKNSVVMEVPKKPGEHAEVFFSKNLRPRNKLLEIHQSTNMKISNGNRSQLERIYDTIKQRDVFNNSIYKEFE